MFLHGKKHGPGHPAPHVRPHGPGGPHHHMRPRPELEDDLLRQISELKAMGAPDEALHDLLDAEADRLATRSDGDAVADPGRGAADAPVSPIERARALAQNNPNDPTRWLQRMASKEVLIAGEFKPHVIEWLLDAGIRVTQIHPPTLDGDPPPHFYHLDGLNGVIEFEQLADVAADFLLFEGACEGGFVRVSPLVPVVLKMFPGVETAVFEIPEPAPHMRARVAGNGFLRIPEID